MVSRMYAARDRETGEGMSEEQLVDEAKSLIFALSTARFTGHGYTLTRTFPAASSGTMPTSTVWKLTIIASGRTL